MPYVSEMSVFFRNSNLWKLKRRRNCRRPSSVSGEVAFRDTSRKEGRGGANGVHSTQLRRKMSHKDNHTSLLSSTMHMMHTLPGHPRSLHYTFSTVHRTRSSPSCGVELTHTRQSCSVVSESQWSARSVVAYSRAETALKSDLASINPTCWQKAPKSCEESHPKR
eukprot:COSAG02_NODE_2443_length_8852_cov_63.348795_10_plen_165_part_00